MDFPENVNVIHFFLSTIVPNNNIPIYKGQSRNEYSKKNRNFPKNWQNNFIQLLKNNFDYSSSYNSIINEINQDTINEWGNDLSILITSNFTTLNYLLEQYPIFYDQIENIYGMIGNFNTFGNVLNVSNNLYDIDAEYNSWLDPNSFKNSLKLISNKLNIIPLDCTNNAPLNKYSISLINQNKDSCFMKLLNATIISEDGIDNIYFWDLVATMIFLGEDIGQEFIINKININNDGKIIIDNDDGYLCKIYNFVNFQKFINCINKLVF